MMRRARFQVDGRHSAVPYCGPTLLTANRLSALAKQLYTEGPVVGRKLQHWRPYICPFETLIAHANNGSRVLDIGCGSGLLLNLMAGLGLVFEGVGFDVSQAAITLAQMAARQSCRLNARATLSLERVEVDAWPDGTFDVVFLVDVLHHIPPVSQEAFLRRAVSKVALDGLLVYKDMCHRPWWKAQANRIHDLLVSRQVISYVPVHTVEKWGRSAGLEVVLRKEISRFWYGHEVRIMRRPPLGAGGVRHE